MLADDRSKISDICVDVKKGGGKWDVALNSRCHRPMAEAHWIALLQLVCNVQRVLTFVHFMGSCCLPSHISRILEGKIAFHLHLLLDLGSAST